MTPNSRVRGGRTWLRNEDSNRTNAIWVAMGVPHRCSEALAWSYQCGCCLNTWHRLVGSAGGGGTRILKPPTSHASRAMNRTGRTLWRQYWATRFRWARMAHFLIGPGLPRGYRAVTGLGSDRSVRLPQKKAPPGAGHAARQSFEAPFDPPEMFHLEYR